MDRQTNDEQSSPPADNESAKEVLPSEDSVGSTATTLIHQESSAHPQGLATSSIYLCFLFGKNH